MKSDTFQFTKSLITTEQQVNYPSACFHAVDVVTVLLYFYIFLFLFKIDVFLQSQVNGLRHMDTEYMGPSREIVNGSNDL